MKKNPITSLIESVKKEHESRKNWEERMNEPLRAVPLTDEEIKQLKSRKDS